MRLILESCSNTLKSSRETESKIYTEATSNKQQATGDKTEAISYRLYIHTKASKLLPFKNEGE